MHLDYGSTEMQIRDFANIILQDIDCDNAQDEDVRQSNSIYIYEHFEEWANALDRFLILSHNDGEKELLAISYYLIARACRVNQNWDLGLLLCMSGKEFMDEYDDLDYTSGVNNFIDDAKFYARNMNFIAERALYYKMDGITKQLVKEVNEYVDNKDSFSEREFNYRKKYWLKRIEFIKNYIKLVSDEHAAEFGMYLADVYVTLAE